MNYVDIILLAIILITSIRGAMRGFVDTLFGFVTVLFSIILTKLTYVPFSDFLMTKVPAFEKLKEFFGNLVTKIGFNDSPLSSNLFYDDLPGPLRVLFHGTKIFASDVTTSELVTKMFVSVLIGIMLFIIYYLMFKALAYFFEGVFSLPVLKQLNKLAGFGVGLLKSIIYVGLLLLFMGFIASLVPNSSFADAILNSKVVMALKGLPIFKTIVDFR